MTSVDYFTGFTDGINDVIQKVEETVKKSRLEYGNMKSYKGYSKQELISMSLKEIERVINEYKVINNNSGIQR